MVKFLILKDLPKIDRNQKDTKTDYPLIFNFSTIIAENLIQIHFR